MAISLLHYSLSAAARERLQRAEREAEHFLQKERAPNRKSEAKKRWWAGKRAKEQSKPRD